MAIIVEDGSGVDGANSYVSLAEFIQYAETRGETIPDTEEAQTSLLFQGVDYLQYSYLWKGDKTFPDAELEWPRQGIRLGKNTLSLNLIPRVIQVAQMKLAILAYTNDLAPVSGASTIREKVDVIEVQYSDTGSTGEFYSPMIENMLRQFVKGSNNGLIQVARVERA